MRSFIQIFYTPDNLSRVLVNLSHCQLVIFCRAMLCISAAVAVMRCPSVCLSRSWIILKTNKHTVRSVKNFSLKNISLPDTNKSFSAISNDENGCRHLCLFIRIFINNFFQLSNHFLLYTPIDLRFQLYLIIGISDLVRFIPI